MMVLAPALVAASASMAGVFVLRVMATSGSFAGDKFSLGVGAQHRPHRAGGPSHDGDSVGHQTAARTFAEPANDDRAGTQAVHECRRAATATLTGAGHASPRHDRAVRNLSSDEEGCATKMAADPGIQALGSFAGDGNGIHGDVV